LHLQHELDRSELSSVSGSQTYHYKPADYSYAPTFFRCCDVSDPRRLEDAVWVDQKGWAFCSYMPDRPPDAGEFARIALEMDTTESNGGRPRWVVAGAGLAQRSEPDYLGALEPESGDSGPVDRRAMPPCLRRALATPQG